MILFFLIFPFANNIAQKINFKRAFADGDYLFYTTTWGHFVARGKDVSTIAVSNNFPLVLSGGTPILHDNKIAGGIFSGYP
ncbi:MAG: hypothetical protein NTY61_01835 [Candidatus Parcubacteria bacterium]|nr:hypothetical protein [Candidatus Parcubacteria bacterium]